MPAKIAVIGAGWWGQGWHIPCIFRNPDADLVAVVDQSEHPQSDMDQDLVSLQVLRERYNTNVFYSVQEMLDSIGSTLDGVVVATPHSTHYRIAKLLHEYNTTHKHNQGNGPGHPIHILMEKPMTTDIDDAYALCDLVLPKELSPSLDHHHHHHWAVWINHSANFRRQAKLAREAVKRIGPIRHISCSMASPVMWVFSNPDNAAWNKPTGSMLGNGFGWGQSCHLLGWVYFVCGSGEMCSDPLKPQQVFCAMNHEPTTGADISHSATVLCDNDIVMNVSGTAYLPGSQYSGPQVGIHIRIQIYGTKGAILYEGEDENPSSGRLELRREDGSTELVDPNFAFVNSSPEGNGAESVQDFVQYCKWSAQETSTPVSSSATPKTTQPTDPPMNCANVVVGLRTVQTLEAMYRSHASKTMVKVR